MVRVMTVVIALAVAAVAAPTIYRALGSAGAGTRIASPQTIESLE